MKISTIEPFVVSHRLKEMFYFSQWQYDTRTICLVKITCDDGMFGWGEGYGPAGVIKSGIEFFRELLIGQDPLETKNIWQIMYLRSLDLVPHTWGTGIAVSAALHLIANLDMVGGRLNTAEALMELDRTENPLRDIHEI